MPRKRREVLRGLRRKGLRERNSGHLELKYLTLAGEDTSIGTLMSHGADRDISDRMLAQMARQLHLSRRQFDQLIDCNLSQAEYEEVLRRDGLIRRSRRAAGTAPTPLTYHEARTRSATWQPPRQASMSAR